MSIAGRSIYRLYYKPKAWVAHVRRQGGLRETVRVWLAMRAMQKAACDLPPIPVGAYATDKPAIAFLTGQRLWFQTAFCLHTFLKHSILRPPVLVLSDGTLSAGQATILASLFPGIRIESTAETTARVAVALPPDRYPVFNRFLPKHILLRKLAHVHPPGSPPRLFLDSDMLFQSRPVALEEWLLSPTRPVFMTDVINAYGYPLDVLADLAGAEIPERLNTGVSGLPSGFIDWSKLETWLETLITKHGTSYYMEQALFALSTAGCDYTALDTRDYVVAPDQVVAANARGVLHHYVNLSKPFYFRQAWRHA